MNINIEPVYEQDWNSQRATYYLLRWYEYDQHINDLSGLDRSCMIELYTRLSYLTDEQRTYLANIYHHPRNEIRTDAQRAHEQGISINDYGKKRRAILSRLSRHRDQPAHDNDFMKQIEQLLQQNTGDAQ